MLRLPLRAVLLGSIFVAPLFALSPNDDNGSKDTPPLAPQEFTCIFGASTASPKPSPSPSPAPTSIELNTGKGGAFSSFPTAMADSFKWKGSGFDALVPQLDPKKAYIFHITTWGPPDSSTGSAPSLKTSSWYLYSLSHLDKRTMVLRRTPPLTGNDPLMYGLSSAVLLAIQAPDGIDSATLKGTYTISISQQAAANLSNTVAVVNALLGATGIKGALRTNIPKENAACVETIDIPVIGESLPYDVSLSFTQTVPSKDDPSKASDGPALKRTIHALDREFWDIGMGMNVLGVKETQITDANGKVTSSVTTRVNAYAFADVYFPEAYFRPKNWFYPHVIMGLPINGKPLHSPFAGLSEPLPFVEKYFGVPVSVFGGIVFLQERIPASLSFVGQNLDQDDFNKILIPHWVKKPMYGVELPLGQLIGKIKSKT